MLGIITVKSLLNDISIYSYIFVQDFSYTIYTSRITMFVNTNQQRLQNYRKGHYKNTKQHKEKSVKIFRRVRKIDIN